MMKVFLRRGLVHIPRKIFRQDSFIPSLYNKKMVYNHCVFEVINYCCGPVPATPREKENVTLLDKIRVHWLIKPYAGKGLGVKNVVFIKVPDLNHPVGAIAGRFDLLSKLVSNLNICDF